MNAAAKKPNPGEPLDDGLELIFIDPKKDVYEAEVVLGKYPIERYKDAALKIIVAKVAQNIKHQLSEKGGYETVKVKVIIKEYKK